MTMPKSAPVETSDSDAASIAADLEAIRKEGLVPRQLRIARRMAQRNGFKPKSDFDAVRLLRENGIDPFGKDGSIGTQLKTEKERQNRREKRAAKNKDGVSSSKEIAKIDPKSKDLAPTEPEPALEREISIRKIQRDLIRRQRRRLFGTYAKLLIYVGLPTLASGYYFHNVATPMYSSFSQFTIEKAESPAMQAPSLGGLGASALANVTEAVTTQNYLTSRDVMLQLDEDYGFKSLFSAEKIDPLQRLDQDASLEAFYKLYKKRIKIGFDPTEGIIRLEVSSPDPQASYDVSNLLHGYAEEWVDQLTARSRQDRMKGAEDGYQQAENALEKARGEVLRLQKQKGILSSDAEVQLLMNEISAMTTAISETKIQLDELMSNPRPNQARIDTAERMIERLTRTVTEKRDQLTQGTEGQDSLASIQAELESANAELEMRQSLLVQSIQNMETARIDADRQTIYLNRAVAPVVTDESSYPRAFENTAVTFVAALVIYMMISLTFSILREQMST